MISVSNITVSFSGHDLFKDLSFIINDRDRIGLVGKNGVGKSTLLNVISGRHKPDVGTIATSEGVTIGYLPQEIKFTSNRTVIEETRTIFEEEQRIEKAIAAINTEMGEREDYESEGYLKLINQLTELHERQHVLNASKTEGQLERVLKGLGFSTTDFERPIKEFSGGWQMRVELAKLLILRPTLLLLDEPTNHLDIESILWLEDFFKNYPGALMMISHDRMFLDQVTNRTIEIIFGRIYDYKVPYTRYMVLREERYQQQLSTYKNQQKYIAQQERFIERFRAKATKAKQVQSKQKQLDKLERVSFDEMDQQSIQFRFPAAPRSGDVVLRSKQLGKRYGDLTVLRDLNFEITRGEKVAFVGKNGEGKSTLVKMINGEELTSGELTLGHNVDIGYYAQVQENTLDQEVSVLDTIEHAATDEWRNISRIRGLLGAFLFREDDIDKKVKVLSGGEKSRLALAKLLLNPVNLLILDEPTNHLDIAAKEVLKQALIHFNGTLIVVSHDRDFLNGLTDRTFEFSKKQIREHLGPINEFLEKHRVENFRELEENRITGKTTAKAAAAPVSENKAAYQNRKEHDRQVRQLKSTINKLEKRIAQLEIELATMEEKMADPEFYAKDADAKETFFQHGELQKKLDQKMTQWEKAQAELDSLSSQ